MIADLWQAVASGVMAGSTYALMALGLVLVYKTSEVVNFAQGEIALAATFVAYLGLEHHGVPWWAALPGALAFAALLGAAVEFGVLRRAKDPSVLGTIIITIGLEMVFLGLVSWKFGADPKTLPFPLPPYDGVSLAGAYVSSLELLTAAAAVGLMLALYLVLAHSRLGLAIRATQQNRDAARLMGVRTRRVLMATWALASAVGALGGLLIAPVTMHPYMMWDPLLKGFAAAVLGGLTSLPGAVAGAYLLGVTENLFGAFVSLEFKSVVAFAAIVAVLCVRPSGLFARHHVKKV